MRKLVLGSLIAVAIAVTLWLSNEGGPARGSQVSAAAVSEAPAAPETIESPVSSAERREVEPLGQADSKRSAFERVALPEHGGDPPIFHGRVVDAFSQRPIAGAKALLARGAFRRALSEPVLDVELQAESDAGGRFAFAGRAVKYPRYGLILCDGHGPLIFAVGPGHESEADAAWLELLPAARLEVRVTDHLGEALPGIGVELQVNSEMLMLANSAVGHSGPELVESAFTDPDGRATFESLPPETLLELRFTRGKEQLAAVETLALRPGEQRSIERTVGLATVSGRVVDQDGVAVSGLYLWRTSKNAGDSLLLWEHAVEQGATSEENGEFVFQGVPYGAWLIGASPLHAKDVSSRGTLVVVDRHQVDLELRVTRGSPIAGRVLEVDGAPAFPAWVWARRLEDAEEDGVFAETDEQGSFRFGSVEPGRYELRGGGFGFPSSLPVTVEAGVTDTELRVQPESVVPVRLLGLGRFSARVRAMDPSGTWLEMMGTHGDRCELTLANGTYSLVAVAPGDRIGARTALLVDSSRVPEELVLELLPGAKLTLVNDDSVQRELSVLAAGGPIYREPLAAGTSATRLVPAGDVRVELKDGERVVAAQTVTLAPLERRRLVLAPE